MIIESILNLLSGVITTVFGLLPNIPKLELTNSIEVAFSTIFDNLQLLGVFIRPATIKLIIPVFIVIYNFEYIYKITLWILKKIPMLNIH